MDEEAAMEAAADQVLTGRTNIVSCIWHMLKNIRRHIKRVFPKRVDQEAFMDVFNEAREAITEDAFRMIWMGLCQRFGGEGRGERREPEIKSKVKGKKVEKVKGEEKKDSSSQDDQLNAPPSRALGPWVKTIFTAGMRSSQRVEMTHRLIKMLGVNSQTPLQRLLEFISTKLNKELAFAIVGRVTNHSKDLDGVIACDLKMVLSASSRFLDHYAMSQMRIELAQSYGFQHRVIDPQSFSQDISKDDLSRENLLRRSICTIVENVECKVDKVYLITVSSTESTTLPEYMRWYTEGMQDNPRLNSTLDELQHVRANTYAESTAANKDRRGTIRRIKEEQGDQGCAFEDRKCREEIYEYDKRPGR
ncbi:hypothetical protein KI688_003194 [Linnemannia hyalina]|uniref:Uncharacterized protein n=1 Tax=Linnemannia hyalina TaxID=64524 RepID=A0A9P8BTG3_9FUNG|nr:hypothetical protein KI688_003194 [Linnemannia hyalina]